MSKINLQWALRTKVINVSILEVIAQAWREIMHAGLTLEESKRAEVALDKGKKAS